MFVLQSFPFTINLTGHIFSCSQSNELYYTTNDGSNWIKISDEFRNNWIEEIVITPNGTIFTLTFHPADIFRSNDNGLTWTIVNIDI